MRKIRSPGFTTSGSLSKVVEARVASPVKVADRERERLVALQLDRRSRELPDAQLRPRQVGEDRDPPPDRRGGGADRPDGRAMGSRSRHGRS